MLPVVAIVGRPNVGKSTLFNRLLGQRKAIVEDLPGVTRDRNYAEVTRFDKPFMLIDTGGFEPVSEDRLLVQMREQSQLAMEEADVILFVLDVRQGLTPSDEEVAGMLRRVEKPVLLVVNKVDGERQESALGEFYGLGLEQLVAVSAEHGRGIDDLLDLLLPLLPSAAPSAGAEGVTRLAVIGRPNVGKSSLVNRLLGAERMVANPTAGTTRDSVDTPFTCKRKPYLLIDTAGIRRKGRVSEKLEKFSVIQALKAMERAEVVLLVIDAVEGVTDQDVTIAGYAYEQGRGIVIVVNKWDLLKKDNSSVGKFVERIRLALKFLPFAPIVFVSAVTGQRVPKIMDEVEKVAAECGKRVGTPVLNRVLQEATQVHPPPMHLGKRVKIFYATQTGVYPPVFTFFVNAPEGIHFSYERYLANKLREAFGFSGSPIRLFFRAKE